MTSTYYWRAVRRIAKRLGISIPAARKKDWQKEARAEFKRRSQAHVRTPAPRTKAPTKPGKPSGKHVGTGISRKRKKVRHPAKRDVFPKRTGSGKPTPRSPIRKLTGGGGPAFDEEEYEEYEPGGDYGEWEQTWEDDWEDLYPTLDDMDDLEEFLDDFEYEDSDKYKEPS